MNCMSLTGSGDWKTERHREQLNDSEFSNLYPPLEAFTVWVGELAARQSLTTGSAESAESSNLSQPLKPGYVYWITAPQDSGRLKERRVELGHQFRGLVCSVGTFTQRQPTGRQRSTDRIHQCTMGPPSSTVTCSVLYMYLHHISHSLLVITVEAVVRLHARLYNMMQIVQTKTSTKEGLQPNHTRSHRQRGTDW